MRQDVSVLAEDFSERRMVFVDVLILLVRGYHHPLADVVGMRVKGCA